MVLDEGVRNGNDYGYGAITTGGGGGGGSHAPDQTPSIHIHRDNRNGNDNDAAWENARGRGRNCLLLNWEDERELVRDEISGMARLAAPVILTYLLETLPGIVTIVLVGRVQSFVEELENGDDDGASSSMQKLHLDAAALAVMFTNVVALSPAFGILTAMDTLCSQAHGAKQPQKMGTYILTGLSILSCMLLVGSFLVWNASSILISLKQPVEVSTMTGEFIRYMLPGVPFLYFYELMRKVFQSRNDALPMLWAAVVCNIVNVVLGYYLVKCTDLGWIGAAVARTAGNIMTVPTTLIAMIVSGGGQDGCNKKLPKSNSIGWESQQYLEINSRDNSENGDRENGGNIEFLHHLWEGFVISDALSSRSIIEFLSIGIPGMLQVMFEWCAFEAIALLCGILPHDTAIIGLGANAIIVNVSSITYMLYLGVSVSGSVRVGNALGAGDVHRAEIATNLTLYTGCIMAFVNIAFLLSCRNQLAFLFTTDMDVVAEAQLLFLVVALFQLPDSINASIQGIFRGSGRMAIGALWNFIAYYVVGLPLGYVLGVRFCLGVEGLWLGMTAGLCVICVGCLTIINRSDWKQLSLDAATRISG